MLLRSTFVVGLLALSLSAAPAGAQPTQHGDHLAYYTYYKTKSGETVSGVAAKFGLAETSLLRMNPQLEADLDVLPDGSLLCVPQTEEPQIPLVKKTAKKVTEEPREAARASSKPEKKSRKKKKEIEEPDEDEWEILADFATKGAPKLAVRDPAPELPPSRFIGSNGQVVLIPAAKPKPVPKPKREDTPRGELASRKGKAIHDVLATCRSFIGTPFVWGGEQPGGFDCSGYVQYVFAQHGYRLPRTADYQFEVGDPVRRGDEKPGDLVFFETYMPGASHVGVYLGRDYFIHASSSRGVTIDRLSTDFFAQRYLGAKRNKY